MPKTWEKVLYKKQNVPDNYVDASFLSDLRKNVNLYKYTLWEAFTGVCVVTHEICCTVLFVVIFVFLKEDIFSSITVLSGVALMIFLTGFIQQLGSRKWWRPNMTSICEHFKSFVIFLSFSYMFSPILKTLTQSVSTDTIHAMVFLMMLSHIIFQDYGSDAAIVSSTLSLNSALFAAVCLSSRLPTVQHTFTLVILSVMIFVLFPPIRRELKDNVPGILFITFISIIVVFCALSLVSTVYATLFGVLCLCVNIVCPALFVYCQKYKENIFGPWDEATVIH